MNRIHRVFCRSSLWRRSLEKRLLPWALAGLPTTGLGDDVLEVGPGPGLVTDFLRSQNVPLTSIEIDSKLARALRARVPEDEVTVVGGDATDMPFADGCFSAALSFTMLHHVPSASRQDQLLAEVCRVLRPGGIFVGSDSLSSRAFEMFHWFDTLVPVDPKTLGSRLEAAGFEDIEVETASRSFRFRAKRPG